MIKEDLFNLYSSDPELTEKWHIRAGEGIEVCVDDTWDIIKNHELYMYDWGYFSKFDQGKIPRLGGFFIKPEYRTSEGKQLFFNEVCDKMQKSFVSALHNKNIRGVKFLKSLPGSNIITTTDSYTFFVFRQEKE